MILHTITAAIAAPLTAYCVINILMQPNEFLWPVKKFIIYVLDFPKSRDKMWLPSTDAEHFNGIRFVIAKILYGCVKCASVWYFIAFYFLPFDVVVVVFGAVFSVLSGYCLDRFFKVE